MQRGCERSRAVLFLDGRSKLFVAAEVPRFSS